MDSRTIVLNADYSFLNTISTKKAICLIVKGKAEVVKSLKDKLLYNFEKTVYFEYPLIIKLVKLVRLMFKKDVPLSKRNIFVRDDYTCQYCGREFKFGSKSVTIDHIKPRSKGGVTSWNNCVTSCKECNTKKGNKKLSEVNLTLLKKPTKPTIGEFINKRMCLLGIDKMLNDFFKGELWEKKI